MQLEVRHWVKMFRHIIILALVVFLLTGCSAIGERNKDYDNSGIIVHWPPGEGVIH